MAEKNIYYRKVQFDIAALRKDIKRKRLPKNPLQFLKDISEARLNINHGTENNVFGQSEEAKAVRINNNKEK